MKNLNVRLSEELHARLKATAAQDKRSLNSEILILLDRALAVRELSKESRDA
jgi:predicted HicB family RNase H-like nuclease